MNDFKKVLYIIFSKFSVIFTSAFTSLYIAKFLGAEGNGTYALLLLLSNALIIFSTFGLPTSLTYFLVRESRDKHFIKTSVMMMFITFIVFSFLLSVINLALGFTEYLLIIFLYSLARLVNNLLQAIYYGKEKFNRHSYQLAIFSFLQVLLLLLFFQVIEIIEPWYILILLGSTWIMFSIFQSYDFKSELYDKYSFHELDWEVIWFGFKTYINNVLAFIIYRVDLLIVALLLSIHDVGNYSVAISITEALSLISVSIASVYFNKFIKSEISKNSFYNELKVLFLSLTVSTSIIAAYFIFLREILLNIVGLDYTYSFLLLDIMVYVIVITSITKILAMIFVARKLPLYNTIASFIVLIFGGITSYLLVGEVGLMGAGYAFLFANIVNLFIKIIQYRILYRYAT